MPCWSDPNQINRYDARAGYGEANHVGWNQTIAKGGPVYQHRNRD
ncbi:hypothetical protein [Thiohalophilus thiocyanatoxydans]|uniref:Uncharacterized protein n=1 Tax=Thiohalophilus thiocyanatoxydans TaxID=381308 RepID=A0A4R8IJT5_9GAMM|nr:hypothetical protein [Thiohalophilus thiocyanatoxydans]TDY00618.1 hypothetical protein EDC23_2122 [Thiohalophilus thiocyanatoxydans]